MNCSRCGGISFPEENFCKQCGAQIISSVAPQQSGVVLPVGGTVNQSNFQEISHQNSMSNQVHISHDDLVEAYIGKNAKKIMKSKFSWLSFFLTAPYFGYRKMYSWAFVAVISFYSVRWSLFFIFILQISAALSFNKMYLKYANDEVQKIKAKNPHATPEQLLLICKEKGGTNLWLSFVIIAIQLIYFVISF